MAVGNNVPFMGYESVLAIAPETTFGTFVTGTAWIEFNNESLKHTVEQIRIESINGRREFTKVIPGNVTVDGAIEAPLNLASDGLIHIIRQALGGTTSVVAASGTSYTHTFKTGNMEDNTMTAAHIKGLSIAVRPGASSNKTWNFFGCRVNNLTIKAEAGSPVILTAEFIGQGCSTSATIPAAVYSDVLPCNFVGATIQTGATSASLSQEYFKSFELTINNNLDAAHRVLGSDKIVKSYPVKQDVSLKLAQVFDTTTAYDRFTALTSTYFEITLDSQQALGASAGTYKMIIYVPNCKLSPLTPSVGGPGPISQELEYKGYYASTQAYAVQMTVRNKTASY